MTFNSFYRVLLVPVVLLIIVTRSASTSGQKLLSFPSLVSILKARNNNTIARPVLAVSSLAQRPVVYSPSAQQMVELQLQSPIGASSSSPASPISSKHENLCYPISRERNTQITKLCTGTTISNLRDSPSSSEVVEDKFTDWDNDSPNCLERFCVTIIAEEETLDDDTIEQELESAGKEIVAYTECEEIPPLFRVLRKSGSFPKCYDCSS